MGGIINPAVADRWMFFLFSSLIIVNHSLLHVNSLNV